MNVMIDTNIILDDILNRTIRAKDARRINQLVIDNRINGYVTANSITDIHYIVSKNCGGKIAREVIRNLLVTFNIVTVEGKDCLNALDLPLSDFEDALVVTCANKAALSYIITNDTIFLQEVHLSVPSISPTDFLLEFEKLSQHRLK